MESDFLRVVVEFQHSNPLAPLFGVLKDAREFASRMEVFSLCFSHRTCNSIAHCLAKTYSGQIVSMLEGPFPVLLLKLACDDVQLDPISCYQ